MLVREKFGGWIRTACFTAVTVGAGFVADEASAFDLAPVRFEDTTITMEVDYDSFRQTSWPGELSGAVCAGCPDWVIEKWIAWAFEQWLQKADIDLTITLVPSISWEFDQADNKNTIAVTEQVCPTTPLAGVRSFPIGNDLNDANLFICPPNDLVGGGLKTYTWKMSEVGPNGGDNCQFGDWPHFDVPSILVHEIGHLLGLLDVIPDGSNVDQSIMRGSLAPGWCNQFHSRYPTPDDILGLRAAWAPGRPGFGVSADRRGTEANFREMTGSGWATAEAGPTDWISLDQPESRAAIGERFDSGTDSYVMVTSLRGDFQKSRVHRTAFPIGSGSWNRKTLSTDTAFLGAPDIDARNHPGIVDRWIIAGAGYQYNLGTCDYAATSCDFTAGGPSSPELFWSSDAFSSSLHQVTLPGSTNLTPSIAWHPTLGRWIVAYQSRVYDPDGPAWGGGGGSDGHVMLAISTNMSGNLYNAPIDTGVYTTSPPSVACSNSECTLAWTSGDTLYPYTVMQQFTTTHGGVITWGSNAQVSNLFAAGGDVGVRGGSSETWAAVRHWNYLQADARFGFSALHGGSTAPPTGTFSTMTPYFVGARPSLGASATHDEAYLFFNEY